VHGSTFGGNALACAAALATIRTIEDENLPQRAAALGSRLVNGLQAIDAPLIREVRGLGLMVGLELRGRVGRYLAKLAKPVDGMGVLALTAGSTVMRFLPPLVIGEDEVDMVVERVGRVVTADDRRMTNDK
jgi:acetylornithine/LysW-gamma-L-lysine aminotransferase